MHDNIINKSISYTKKCQNHISWSFAYKVVCLDNKCSKKIVLYEGKNFINVFIKSIPNKYNYCKKIMRKYFDKNLIISAEENGLFELTNICWIYDKLIDVSDDKVRDHCHITGKYTLFL